MRKPKGLRDPIRTTINGNRVTLVTVGYLADALGRTVWTIKHWQWIGLLPPTPYYLNQNRPAARRGLFPCDFVDQLREIANHGYMGQRLDRHQWVRFHNDVLAAWETTALPLINGVDIEGESWHPITGVAG